MKTSRISRAFRITLVALLPLAFACGPPPGAFFVSAPPPPPRVEVRGTIPGPGYVWIEGHYAWIDRQYVWREGSWRRPPRSHARWVPGHWRHNRRGWFWIEGHWRR